MNTSQLKDSPCGQLVPTDEGALAFVPDQLPRQVELDSSLIYRLDEASRAVATLGGVGETLLNPHLLIVPFLRREAVLSSRIEGTQASIADVFMFEASGERREVGDAREVLNYIHALHLGLDLLKDLPVCVRLVNSIHARLLEGVRGEDKTPGHPRAHQNWIVASRTTPILEARYMPPPPRIVPDLFDDWERFVNEDLEMPPLIQAALMHYQFEAIHPYLDGNGRIGRLLISLFLCAKNVTPSPLLYLSAYFERNRDEYYDQLLNLSVTGNWQPWLRFFVTGVAEQAQDALLRSRRVRELHERYRGLLQDRRESGYAFGLVDELFANPYVTIPRASKILDVTYSGAQGILNRLAKLGIVEPVAGRRWPRLYVASELLDVIQAPVA